MAGKFIELAEGFLVAPQIAPDDVAAAAARGVRLIISNRPDGEEPGQPKNADIAAAAEAAGVAFVSIPVGGAGVGEDHLDRFDAALAEIDGPVLAYCRTGTRSTVLRALARARAGADAGDIMSEAAAAGYNLSNIAPRLEALSRAGRSAGQ